MTQENTAELLRRIDDLQEQIDRLRAEIHGGADETIDIDTLAPSGMLPGEEAVPEKAVSAGDSVPEEPETEERATEIVSEDMVSAEGNAPEEPETEESAPEIVSEDMGPAEGNAPEEPEREEGGSSEALPPAETGTDQYKDYRWMADIPGSAVSNIISGISLNDRILLINRLFGEDPSLFQTTISTLNALGSLNEAIDYIRTNFPDWDLSSDVVYSLIMAVRRKLR
ncbi:MAG: hypothetical protein MJY44_03680 [Bacteroidales bacterium]|nr:hypothetical protein [Bacteroidales bacterium]